MIHWLLSLLGLVVGGGVEIFGSGRQRGLTQGKGTKL